MLKNNEYSTGFGEAKQTEILGFQKLICKHKSDVDKI